MGEFPNQPGWGYLPSQSAKDTKEFVGAITWGIRQWWSLLLVSSPFIIVAIFSYGLVEGYLQTGDFVLAPILLVFSLWLSRRRLRYLFCNGFRAGVIWLIAAAIVLFGVAGVALKLNFML